MLGILAKKAWTDLTRRKARTFFTVLTIAIAIASVGIFAVAPLFEEAMAEEVEASNLFNIQLALDDVNLTQAELAEIRALDNVADLEVRSYVTTKVFVGERRVQALVIGVEDFSNQSVDIVALKSGVAPGDLQALSDSQNSRAGSYDGGIGDVIPVIGTDGELHNLTITGTGRSLWFSGATSDGWVVLYAPMDTVRAIGNINGYNLLEVVTVDQGTEAANRTVADIKQIMVAGHQNASFTELPEIRDAGTYPGQETFENFGTMFSFLTFIALLTGIFLIANTMNTLIGEQVAEIGMLKAVGAQNWQIGVIYMLTAIMLGTLGSMIGIPLGTMLTWGMIRLFGGNFYAVFAPYSIHWGIVWLSLFIGIIGTALVSIPALYRATRIPVRTALESRGVSSAFGTSWLDRRIVKLSRLPNSMLIGLRSITRRKGRSFATILQVAIAVGTMAGMAATGVTIGTVTAEAWDTFAFDFEVSQAQGGEDFTTADVTRLANFSGVAAVEPSYWAEVSVDGERTGAIGMLWNLTMWRYDLDHGRWFHQAEYDAAARVLVIGYAIANDHDIKVGDTVTVATAATELGYTVIGIDGNLMNNGRMVMLPLTTMQVATDQPDRVNQFYIRTTSDDHAFIDRTTTEVEDGLTEQGYSVNTMIHYVGKEANMKANAMISYTLLVIGLLIVTISMIGLVNAITMNVIERTREIGILRCIGASSWSVRGMFGFEGLTLAFIGWLVSIPVGYAIGFGFVAVINSIFSFHIGTVFPVWIHLVTLPGTLIVAALIMLIPLRRATGFAPGEALRYQ